MPVSVVSVYVAWRGSAVLAGAGVLFQAELQGELKGWAVIIIVWLRDVEPLLLWALSCWHAWERWLGLL
jgi:hypothetical protein